MKKLNVFLTTFLVIFIFTNAYFTTRIWNFITQQSVYNEYLNAKLQCSLDMGIRLRQDRDFIKKNSLVIYDTDVPSCREYYARHKCWVLDPKDPVSLDKCGPKFGYSKEQIELMKNIKKIINLKTGKPYGE